MFILLFTVKKLKLKGKSFVFSLTIYFSRRSISSNRFQKLYWQGFYLVQWMFSGDVH